MNQIEKSRTQKIVSLHLEITGHLKKSLEKAIELGGLLAEQKQTLAHGEFMPWIEVSLPFTGRTARNYMRLFKERDRLKTETVSDLKSAYKLLVAPDSRSADSKHLEKLKNKLDRTTDIVEIRNMKNEADAISQAAEKKLLDTLPSEDDLFRILDTEYFKATPIGLIKKREPTKEECIEYLRLFKLVDDMIGFPRMKLERPSMPNEWDYDESVKKVKRLLAEKGKIIHEGFYG